jgi:hypothetical protein
VLVRAGNAADIVRTFIDNRLYVSSSDQFQSSVIIARRSLKDTIPTIFTRIGESCHIIGFEANRTFHLLGNIQIWRRITD